MFQLAMHTPEEEKFKNDSTLGANAVHDKNLPCIGVIVTPAFHSARLANFQTVKPRLFFAYALSFFLYSIFSQTLPNTLPTPLPEFFMLAIPLLPE